MRAAAKTPLPIFARNDKKTRREAPAKRIPPVVEELPPPKASGKPTQGIYVQGEPDMLVRFARCCNPVPGDDIVGYITRGRGVTVHKADCINALHVEEERVVNVSWAEEETGEFSANFQIICYDHPSLLGEITAFVDALKMPITAVAVKVNKNKTCSIMMTVKVHSRAQLDDALKKLQNRSDVIEAYRSAK